MIQKPEQVQKKMVAVSFWQFLRYDNQVIPIPRSTALDQALFSNERIDLAVLSNFTLIFESGASQLDETKHLG